MAAVTPRDIMHTLVVAVVMPSVTDTEWTHLQPSSRLPPPYLLRSDVAVRRLKVILSPDVVRPWDLRPEEKGKLDSIPHVVVYLRNTDPDTWSLLHFHSSSRPIYTCVYSLESVPPFRHTCIFSDLLLPPTKNFILCVIRNSFDTVTLHGVSMARIRALVAPLRHLPAIIKCLHNNGVIYNVHELQLHDVLLLDFVKAIDACHSPTNLPLENLTRVCVVYGEKAGMGSVPVNFLPAMKRFSRVTTYYSGPIPNLQAMENDIRLSSP